MGSVEAWLFTQRTAGLIMTVVGLILHKVAKSATKKFVGLATAAMAETAFELIKSQIKWILAIYIFMFFLTMIAYNRKGVNRFRKLRYPAKATQRAKAAPAPAQQEIPEAEYVEEIPENVEYERQGEQVITADDIVIEGLDE